MKKFPSNWLALIIVLTAPLLSVIDVFIINVAIPSIKRGIHATDGQVQLVIAGYLLGYASFLITGGKSGDHFGRKKVFFWGMLGFTIFSCFCGMAQTALQLNSMRFLQGISASFMVPQSIAYIQVLFTDPKERAKAIGWFGITLGMASIIGQVLGGYLSEKHFIVDGWRLIFFINLPIGVAALWATHTYLKETEKHHQHKLDLSGVLILTAALFCLIFPLIQGREAGWPWWSFTLFLLSGMLFLYFISDQAKKRKRGVALLVDIELFAFKDFNIGLGVALFHFMMHTSYLLISAVFMQSGLGISPLASGLYFVLPGILFTLSSLIASRLIPKYGKGVLQVGVIFIILTFILEIIFFRVGVRSMTLFLLQGMYGLGNGLVLPSLLNITLRSVPGKFAGAAAGIYSTFQQTASALGVCIVGGIFYYVIDQHGIIDQHRVAGQGHEGADFTRAFHDGIAANIVCLLLASFLLTLLPPKKPAESPLILGE